MGTYTTLMRALYGLCLSLAPQSTAGGDVPPIPYWPEWATSETSEEASASDIAAGLGWVSRKGEVPCIVPVPDDGADGPPAWTREPAGLPAGLMVGAAVGRWARDHGHRGFTTPHYVLLVPGEGQLASGGLTGIPYGLETAALHLAMATAPADVATRLAAGSKVLVQLFSDEAQAAFVRALVVNRSGHNYTHSLETPLGMAVGLAPTLVYQPDPQGADTMHEFALLPGLRQRNQSSRHALGVVRSLAVDPRTRRAQVTEWVPDGQGADVGGPPDEVSESLKRFQTQWLTARQRLQALQASRLDLGGRLRVGDLCRRITGCPVDAGPFANALVWSTPSSVPCGSAVQCLALAVRARIVPEADGLRLDAAHGYAIPEPLELGVRWASSRLPDREDLRLACLAIDDGPLRPFGELDPATRDTVRACIAASEQPPTIVDATMVRLEPLLIHSTQRLLLTRDETASANQTGSVRLRVSPRFGSTVAFSGDRCTHVLVDPYVLDLLPWIG